MVKRFTVNTKKMSELIDITGHINSIIGESGVNEGIVVVYCPHTTAGVTINENADPSVCGDILMKTSKLIERDDPDYCHMEGNSDGHVKSSLFGASELLIIEGGRLVLGTWQGVYFAEFDGPRTRSIVVKIMEG